PRFRTPGEGAARLVMPPPWGNSCGGGGLMQKRQRATDGSRETDGACAPPLSARWVVGSTVLSVVEFFGFATGRVERRVASLERSIARGPPGLTVSPDGRWIPYTRIDQSVAGIYAAGKLSAPRRAASLGCGVPEPTEKRCAPWNFNIRVVAKYFSRHRIGDKPPVPVRSTS